MTFLLTETNVGLLDGVIVSPPYFMQTPIFELAFFSDGFRRNSNEILHYLSEVMAERLMYFFFNLKILFY